MSTAPELSIRTKKAATGGNSKEELARLANEIQTTHGEIKTLHGQALDHAREAGEALDKAKAICRRARTRDKSSPCWGKWVPATLGMTRHMAQIYVRIFKNWALVQHLEGDERSIHGAIRFLRGKSARSVNALKPITIAAMDLFAAAERLGLRAVVNVAKVEAFANEILQLAHIARTIKVGGRQL